MCVLIDCTRSFDITITNRKEHIPGGILKQDKRNLEKRLERKHFVRPEPMVLDQEREPSLAFARRSFGDRATRPESPRPGPSPELPSVKLSDRLCHYPWLGE